MQPIRHLVRRINPKFIRQAVLRPSIEHASTEAGDARDEHLLQQHHLFDDKLKSQSDILSLFREVDANGDGRLDDVQLGKALRRGHLPTSRQSRRDLLAKLGTQDDVFVDEMKFLELVHARQKSLRKAYLWLRRHQANPIRRQRQGAALNAEALRRAARKAGVQLSDADVSGVMNRLGSNRMDISYAEFLDCLLIAPDINPRQFLDTWYTESFSDDSESQFTTPREIRPVEEESFAESAAKKIGCGGIAGAASRTLTAPMDRIRVVMMTTNDAQQMGIGRAFAAAMSRGYASLWMGNGTNCLKIAPEMAVKLLSFDVVKNQIANDPSNVSVGERFIAGGVAGMISQFSIYPLEVLKTRLSMAEAGSGMGLGDCFHKLVAEGGVRALYAGIGPSIAGIVPYAAIDLSLNSIIKDHATAYLQESQQEANVPILLASGMTSSGIAAMVTFPLNAIRTKAQATGLSTRAVFHQLWASGRWRAFYRGLLPSLAKVLPATSISYTLYEYLGNLWTKQLHG